MWGSPHRGWIIGPGPKATRYLRNPVWLNKGRRRYFHYRNGTFVLHRDYCCG